MTDAVKSESLIDLMVRIEESAGAFYTLCAAKFPKNSGLWMSLAAAEEQHARYLREIAAHPTESVAFSARRRVAAAPLKALLDSLKRSYALVETTPVTQAQALTMARDFEYSATEKKILDPVAGDPPEVVQTIRRLNSETTNHRVLIESALAALKA